jgi:uncharacterized membrane protein
MSRSGLRAVALTLAAAGIGVAGYLTIVHYTALEPVCAGGGGGCERVQASDQSRLLGVPVALLGLLAYAVMLAAGAARTELARSVAAFTALVGFGFSAYLTQQAVVDIGATCQWCLVSFGLMTALVAVSVARLLRGA